MLMRIGLRSNLKSWRSWMSRLSANGVRVWPSPKRRVCLGCGHRFPSSGPWERFCKKCRSRNSRLGRTARPVHIDPLVAGYLEDAELE